MTERATGGDSAEALRVVLVDDHTMFRHGLRQALIADGFEVAGEASNGRAGAQLVDEVRPDVVVMDLHMPLMGGVEAVREIHAAQPELPVLMLTVSTEEDDVADALAAGAAGYALKTSPPEDVVRAVRAAHAGEGTISARVAAALVERLPRGDAPSAAGATAGLTARELEILRLVAAGKENHEIAEALVISPSTAKNHVARVLDKLGLQNRVQAAVYAVRAGLV